MRSSPRILPIRLLVLTPVRLGRRRHFQADASLAEGGFALRHLALADASRPGWLSAPLFSRHQPIPSAIARHAA